jgi:hypothetical protein
MTIGLSTHNAQRATTKYDDEQKGEGLYAVGKLWSKHVGPNGVHECTGTVGSTCTSWLNTAW